MFKRWYIIETNLYFVPHTREHREVLGPYTKADANRIALGCANAAARRTDLMEYIVTKDRNQEIYGIKGTHA